MWAPLMRPQPFRREEKGSGSSHTSCNRSPERWLQISAAFSSCRRWMGERGAGEKSRQDDRVKTASDSVICPPFRDMHRERKILVHPLFLCE